MTKDLRNELEIALTNHNKKFEQLTQQAVNCENEEKRNHFSKNAGNSFMIMLNF